MSLEHRKQLEAVFRAGLAAVDPEVLIRERLRLEKGTLVVEPGALVREQGRGAQEGSLGGGQAQDGADRVLYNLDEYRRVVVLAAGKGAGPMCRAVETLLGERLDGGLGVTKYGHGAETRQQDHRAGEGPGHADRGHAAHPQEVRHPDIPDQDALSRITLLEAGHPVPDENGVGAARRMLELARSLGPDDLALVLLSGGGSALLPCPVESRGLTLAHKQEATRLLLACGADIGEINTVRKHLSAIKGGGLLRAIHPATCLTLALSDVMGDDPEAVRATIASGPTAPDPTTFREALAVLERYGVAASMPGPVLEVLQQGASGSLPETLKAGDPALGRSHWIMLGDNGTALEAAAGHARALGWQVEVSAQPIRGEAREEARLLAEQVRRLGGHVRTQVRGQVRGQACGQESGPVCLLAGGESVVTLRGKGRGGRNQEMALAFLREMFGADMAGEDVAGDPALRGVTFLAASTDGTDGPTDAAGAYADDDLLRRPDVTPQTLDAALADNDSHTFFQRRGGLLRTGPTGTNVCDLALALIP